MTVTVQTPFNEHTANGVTTVFGYTFKLLLSTDLEVKIDGVVQSSGYTVSGLGVNAGGDVTFTTAPANLAVIQLTRKTPLSRSTDYQVNGDLPSDEVDDDYDRLWLALQDAAYLMSRSLTVPAGDTATSIELPSVATRASQYLAFDANGNPIASSGLASVPVSVAMAAVVTAATLALGRTALGAAASGANGDITSLTALASINGGQIGGNRNSIINGGMAVDQRNGGASQTFTAAAALAYCVDRWYGYCTGANVTGQRVAGSSQSQYRYKFTGAASVTAIGFGHRIEAANCYHLNGQTCTLSVDLSNSLLTTVTWTAYYANTADTFGSLASPTRTQIATGTFTVSSTLTRYSANIAVPAAATTGIEIVFSVGAQTSGTWQIGDVQLELGSVATAFERRSYGMEFSLCQRYFERIGGVGQSIYQRAYCAASAPLSTTIPFAVEKRVAPTLTKVGTWSVSNCAQPTVNGTDTRVFNLQAVATGLADTYFLANTSSEYVTASAEL